MLIDLIKSNKEVEAISFFKSEIFDLNHKDKFNKTLLMYVCEYEMHVFLDILLEQAPHFNINLLDNYEQTALYYACHNQDVYAIEKLIAAGIDLDSINKDLLTALNYCACHNLNVGVSTLLKYSPSFLYTDRLRRTPLLWAAKLNNINMFMLLLKAGVDPDKIDESGMTCLNYMIDQNDNPMINALVNHGANVNLINDLGKNALHHASQFNRIFVINNLIDKGININLADSRGKTALMYACEQNHMDLAKMLITHGAKFSFANSYDCKGFKFLADNISMFNFFLEHTFITDELVWYQHILEKLNGNYNEHIELIRATLLNQRLKNNLYEKDHLEDKKTKI